jgi:hypothetical protein
MGSSATQRRWWKRQLLPPSDWLGLSLKSPKQGWCNAWRFRSPSAVYRVGRYRKKIWCHPNNTADAFPLAALLTPSNRCKSIPLLDPMSLTASRRRNSRTPDTIRPSARGQGIRYARHPSRALDRSPFATMPVPSPSVKPIRPPESWQQSIPSIP